ncbi:hypothetical protein D9611_002628 [Ephemerocybe angulata]|uniref:C2H2-type domain-containing protein n=1 Tax=Ephemerocybe angulata TaxID=980116 RepID=A0A8H5C2D8_9AGAR|nr:hypothetical protein D9611_002628 [Tulosesus angulatus]
MALPRVQTLSAVHYCRWDWCLERFSKPSDLNQHVVNDHILTSKPIRRGDLAAIERAEEGIGESMTIPTQMRGILHQNEPEKETPEKASQQSPELPSSLPTPPGSDAPSPPRENASLPNMEQAPELPQDTGVDPSLLSAPAQTPVRMFSRSRTQSRVGTPNFKTLSSPSPGDSPFIADNPGTPDFDAMVDDAVHRRKRQRVDAGLLGIHSKYPSFVSTTSTSSHMAVERQLTQNLDTLEESDGELQLSDIIHSEKLAESAIANDPVTGPNHEDEEASIKMPVIHPLQSQPFSTQTSDYYAGEIFQAHAIAADNFSQPPPTFGSQVPHSTPKAQVLSQPEEPSSSIELSMPPPAQPRRERSYSASQSQEQVDTSSTEPSFPFLSSIFSIAGTSARQPFYAEAPAPGDAATQASSKVQQSPKSRKPKSKKSRAPTASGTLSIKMSHLVGRSPTPDIFKHVKRRGSAVRLTPDAGLVHGHVHGDRHRHSQPAELELAHPAGEETRVAYQQSQSNSHGQSQADGDDWAHQTQGDDMMSLPPIMTQAPYQSQDMDY